MKPYKKIFLLMIAIALTGAVSLKNYYILSKDYAVSIHGTSNLHSWDEKVGAVSGEGIVSPIGEAGYDLDALSIKMEVRSIKSDMGAVMNNNTYKALKADDNPQIIFILTEPVKAIQLKAVSKIASIKGSLSIAGITKPVAMQVKISMPAQGTLLFEGAQAVKMTDYGIKPPTALLGTLKTGNEITIRFKTNFKLNNSN